MLESCRDPQISGITCELSENIIVPHMFADKEEMRLVLCR
jgi:hypothetical protein